MLIYFFLVYVQLLKEETKQMAHTIYNRATEQNLFLLFRKKRRNDQEIRVK